MRTQPGVKGIQIFPDPDVLVTQVDELDPEVLSIVRTSLRHRILLSTERVGSEELQPEGMLDISEQELGRESRQVLTACKIVILNARSRCSRLIRAIHHRNFLMFDKRVALRRIVRLENDVAIVRLTRKLSWMPMLSLRRKNCRIPCPCCSRGLMLLFPRSSKEYPISKSSSVFQKIYTDSFTCSSKTGSSCSRHGTARA